jgi:integrase
VKLNRTTVKALRLPAGRTDHVVWDDELPGFGLRLRATGARTFVVQYDIGGKSRKVSLGSPSQVNPGQARETARAILAKVRLGRDPAAEKNAARAQLAETFGALLPRYLAYHRAKNRPRSYREVVRYLLVHCKSLHARPVTVIARRDVALLLSELVTTSGPSAANKARASLAAFYTWLLREGITEVNPVSHTNKAAERSRDRVLSDDELVAVWRAAGDLGEYGTIVRLLLLTGSRRDEIGNLQRSEIDLERALITLPTSRVKNNTPHEVPLTAPALTLLEQQLRERPKEAKAVFGRTKRGWQNWSASKRELNARLGTAVAPWTLHDLRRSVSTILHDHLGIEPHIVEAILNHQGHKSGPAGVYNRSSYRSQKRRALELWAEHVLTLVEGRAATVVPLRA